MSMYELSLHASVFIKEIPESPELASYCQQDSLSSPAERATLTRLETFRCRTPVWRKCLLCEALDKTANRLPVSFVLHLGLVV
jgi:hypothetical protein